MRATDTVEVGRTGLRVSRLGLGGVALSGAPPATDPHQPTPETEAIGLIQRSLALGLNYLDTAPMYGVGQSERRYGQALRGRPRDQYVLSTKVGRILQPDPAGGPQLTWAFDFSAAGVRRSFESSLERLGLQRVDILFMHDPDDHYQQALAEAFPVLMDLRAQGQVRAAQGRRAAVHPHPSGHRVGHSRRAFHRRGGGERRPGGVSNPPRAVDRVEVCGIDRRCRARAGSCMILAS